jgi:1,4-dihydroxy-2-naphthoate octaprenyltransferase
MARPLPKDLEQSIKGAASKAEARSSFVAGLIIGGLIGFAIAAILFGALGGPSFFILGALGVAAIWFLAARKKPKPANKLHYKDITLRD